MYGSVESAKWQAVAASKRRRKPSRRRIYIVAGLLVIFLIYTVLRPTPIEHDKKQGGPAIPHSRILPKRENIRDFSIAVERDYVVKELGHESHSHVERKEGQQHSPGRGDSQSLEPEERHPEPDHFSPELQRFVTETTSELAEKLVYGPVEQLSENVTPDELNDEEETNLQRIAVAAKGKEPASPAAAIADISEQLLPGQFDATSDEPKVSGSTQTYDKNYFPPHSQFEILDAMADTMPDIIHIPFEESTLDVVLQGWEDKWFSDGVFDIARWGSLQEPKIDFIYTWVNGSDKAFQNTIAPYELNSSLNDADGKWLEHHRINRYRDWDELRYSIRSLEKYALSFRNKIQILVNAVAADVPSETPAKITGKQLPLWMDFDKQETKDNVQILAQEEFFGEQEQGCLPTFNSLTIENQLHNTKSDTDRIFALSDDMFLGKNHAASDLYSPLFGPTMGFKTNAYNTKEPPTDKDARRFGEKPYLIYTSWLLNRRFGERKRKGQIHFGHSMSRNVTREAINSFPRPALQSSCQRFRGETGFQLYSWYVVFHYTIERQREALLWSYILARSDTNQDGNIGWLERQSIMEELKEGMANESNTTFRDRIFYQVPELLETAGLEALKVNLDVLWTSLDGPSSIRNIECSEFNVNECMAPGFSMKSDKFTNPIFSAASIFDRVARQHPKCGDCLIKLILYRTPRGLAPLLPHKDTQATSRAIVIKALFKYQYTIVEPDVLFMMVTDARQVRNVLLRHLVSQKKEVGQLCLNDDVATEDEGAIKDLKATMKKFFKGFVPGRSVYELRGPKSQRVA